MAQPLKFVFLGTTALEVKELLGQLAQMMNGSELTSGELAGTQIYRFSREGTLQDKTPGGFTVYGGSIESDFRGALSLLVKNADGVVGIVPADLTRAAESRKVLGSIHRAIQAQREEEKELPFLIQYHWPSQGGAISPEELDNGLGINPKAAERVYSRTGGGEVGNGLRALIERFQRLKSSPK